MAKALVLMVLFLCLMALLTVIHLLLSVGLVLVFIAGVGTGIFLTRQLLEPWQIRKIKQHPIIQGHSDNYHYSVEDERK